MLPAVPRASTQQAPGGVAPAIVVGFSPTMKSVDQYPGGSRTGVETAEMVLEHFRWIDGLARAMKPPILARVTRSGVRFFDLDTEAWVEARKKHLRAPR